MKIKISDYNYRERTLYLVADDSLRKRECMVRILEQSGFKFLWSQELDDSIKLTFEKGGKCLIVILFQHGNIEILTKEDVDAFLHLILPHLETKLKPAITCDWLKREISERRAWWKIMEQCNNSACHEKRIIRRQEFASPAEKYTAKIRSAELRKNERLKLKQFLIYMNIQQGELCEMKIRIDSNHSRLMNQRNDVECLRDQMKVFKSDVFIAKEKRNENKAKKKDEQKHVLVSLQDRNPQAFYESIRTEIASQMRKMR